ncbi:hypothetical protein ACLIA0_12930 [Bacillaceae bacterium W0354]
MILTMDNYAKTNQLVVGALLGAIAFILQSTGIFTGVGYMFSMMSTAPIVLAVLLSLRIGLMTYFLTVFLLAIFQPTELLVFSFTTGLLGLGLGTGMKYFKNSMLIISFAALCLTLGIAIVLYGFKFAILGPSVTYQFNVMVILGVFAFSLLYSWIWMKISVYLFKLLE